MLDKGQEDDWFNSHTIIIFAAVASAALITFVIWEWRQEHPIVEVQLFRDRNFAVSNLMMLVLGMALYGTTVLLPQYVQVWMGYSAEAPAWCSRRAASWSSSSCPSWGSSSPRSTTAT